MDHLRPKLQNSSCVMQDIHAFSMIFRLFQREISKAEQLIGLRNIGLGTSDTQGIAASGNTNFFQRSLYVDY